MLQNAISDAVFRMDDIIPSKEPELSFTDIKKLASTTTEKRNEELKKMLQNLGKRAD